MARIQVNNMPEQMKLDFKIACARAGRSMSEMVSELMSKYIKERAEESKTLSEMFED